MNDPGYLGKFWLGGHDHHKTIFCDNNDYKVRDNDDENYDGDNYKDNDDDNDGNNYDINDNNNGENNNDVNDDYNYSDSY